MILAVLFGIALLFMVGPIALQLATGINPGFVVTAVMELVGIAVLLVTAYLSAYRKFYVIAEANQAVIRTGGLGKAKEPEVAIGCGIWVIPMIHKMQVLRFEQYVMSVSRKQLQAFLCVVFQINLPDVFWYPFRGGVSRGF